MSAGTLGSAAAGDGDVAPLFGGGGVMMLRTTQINVFVLGKYSVDLFSIEGRSAPHGLTLSAGATYRF